MTYQMRDASVTWIVLAAVCLSGVAVTGYNRYVVDIPAQSMLVRGQGRAPSDIVAVFPEASRLWITDKRLAGTVLLPYWRWDFGVVRELPTFRYAVRLSIMGTPQEALKYRDKAEADWHRQDLERWSAAMLAQFEAEHGESWAAYSHPPTDAEARDFKALLLSWFSDSPFAGEGIRVDEVVVNLPDLSHR